MRNIICAVFILATVFLTDAASAQQYRQILTQWKLQPVTTYPYIGFDTAAHNSDNEPWTNTEISFEPVNSPSGSVLRGFDAQIGPVSLDARGTYIYFKARTSVPMMIEMSQGKMAGGGRTMQVEVVFTHPIFSRMLDTFKPSLRVRYNLAFTRCDNTSLSAILDPTVAVSGSTAANQISVLIDRFQQVGFEQFYRCQFDLVGPIADASGQNARGELSIRPGTGNLDQDGRIVLTFFRRDYGRIIRTQQVVLEPRRELVGHNSTSSAQTAARRFIRLIKDHGNLIIENSEGSLTQQERSSLIQKSIEQKRGEILELIQQMNDGVKGASLLDQFSVVRSVNSAYAFLQQLEVKVGQLQDRRDRLQLGTIFRVNED